MTKNNNDNTHRQKMPLDKRRRIAEAVSTAGLILLAAGLVAPFTYFENPVMISVFKWIFTAGAVTYAAARFVNVNAPGDSLRLRRLRRMEMWAGIAFCVAAFFWFWNGHRFAGMPFSLAVINDTIMFTLAGALIQIIASWLITSRAKKEASDK